MNVNFEPRETMTTVKAWTTVDKSEWGPGQWTEEPDKVQWVDEETGLDCLIVRNGLGALCGYVGIPPEHPWHGVDYTGCPIGCGESWCDHRPELLDVHGGLTFADSCHEPTEERWREVGTRLRDPGLLSEAERYPEGDASRRLDELAKQEAMTLSEWTEYQQARRICHIPEPGRPAEVWWFGFDCSHAWDAAPNQPRELRGYGVYRTRAYVESEVRKLARQLVEVAAPLHEDAG